MVLSGPQRVISFNYTLKDSSGQIIDQSAEGPMSFLTGVGQIIPKLEEELKGMMISQKKNVKLAAADAYGLPDPKMVMDVPKADLAHLKIEVGGFLQLNLGQTMKVVRIAKISEESVTLDGNHPLAGQDLEFDVEVMNSREATAEEVAHGHAHGPGGHHH
ncbi:MAG: peptidylprolyl isomerase [Bdellovibrionaceae bacterium]|nr:peptidylprolyl isomerase [Pseudobdellovibrionaceae bacterium]